MRALTHSSYLTLFITSRVTFCRHCSSWARNNDDPRSLRSLLGKYLNPFCARSQARAQKLNSTFHPFYPCTLWYTTIKVTTTWTPSRTLESLFFWVSLKISRTHQQAIVQRSTELRSTLAASITGYRWRFGALADLARKKKVSTRGLQHRHIAARCGGCLTQKEVKDPALNVFSGKPR